MNLKFKNVARISIFISISIVFCLLLTPTAVLGQSPQKQQAKCPGKVKILVGEVAGEVFNQFHSFEKSLEPGKIVNVASPAPGAVKKVAVAAGSVVKAGDLLVELDDTLIKKELAEAQANLKKWERILWQRQHWKQRSPKAEKKAELNVKKESQKVSLKLELLKKTRIFAPIDGKIDAINVKESDHISEGFVLGTLLNTQYLKIHLDSFTDKVTENQKINLKIKQRSTAVNGFVKKAENGDTYIVIKNIDQKIQPGVSATFAILVKRHDNVIVLPKSIIFKDDNGTYVYLTNGKRAQKTYVKTGPSDKQNAVITEGLSLGAQIITTEIFPGKEAAVKDTLSCIKDNKKIKIMVMDEAKGKFVKRKKDARPAPVKNQLIPPPPPPAKKDTPVKKEQPVKKDKVKEEKPVQKEVQVQEEKPIEQKPPARPVDDAEPRYGKLKIGASVAYHLMLGSDFKDVYGNMLVMGLDVAYAITDNLDIWLYGGTGSKTAAIDWAEEDLQFKFTPVTLNMRYYFKRDLKWEFFAGAGINLYPFKDISPLGDIKETAFGFNLLAGTYYRLTNNFLLQLALRFNLVTKAIENVDSNLNMNSAELLFGITYSL